MRRRRRFAVRWVLFRRVLVLSLAFTVLFGVGLPDDGTAGLKPGTDTVGGFVHAVVGFFSVPPLWAGPLRPKVPQQASGTAAGRAHQTDTRTTRAAGGVGHAPGKGVGELPADTASPRKVTKGESAGVSKGFNAKTSKRDPKKSTATTDYYTNADGSVTRKIATSAVNYVDGNGAWQPIDTTLHQGIDGRWREQGNTVPGGFARFADDPALLTGGTDGAHTFAEGLVGAAHVPAVVADATVTFPGALPSTDVRLTATRRGQREDLVLHDASAATTWTENLALTGLTASIDRATGDIDLANAAGKTVLALPAGTATDAAQDKHTGERPSTRVRYALTGQTLVASIDPAWLHDPARQFPVTVDPEDWFTATYTESGIPAADNSAEGLLKVGSLDAGTHNANSFLEFPDSGIDNSGITATDATLQLWAQSAATCTPEEVDVAPITQAWTPQSAISYPGPTFGTPVAKLSPAVPVACGSTTGTPDNVEVPIATSIVNGWANGTLADYGLGLSAPTTDALHWKTFSSGATDYWVPMLYVDYNGGGAKTLPYIYSQDPPNGGAPGSLTPLLSAEGTGIVDDPVVLKYQFLVYSADGIKVADSGLVTTNSFRVPLGALQWGRTYSWTVQAYDGTNYSPNPVWNDLSTAVPQPAVTSSLSQNSDQKGYDPSIGNFTTSATDADIATVGPELSIQRDYNSRDPRTAEAFGAAWSSLLDARVTEHYDETGAVDTAIVTYPTGAEVAFGRNVDGSFTAPAGRAATLIHEPAGYELVDQSGTAYSFNQVLLAGTTGTSVVGISKVADVDKHQLSITGTAASGTTVLQSQVSGRKLTIAWQTPSGTANPHVASVTTDAVTTGDPLVWTYHYTGDLLTSVCPPESTTACTVYGYKGNAPANTRNQVLDQGATSYWPLSETSGTTASSAVLADENTDTGTYANVALAAGPGPLAASAAGAPSFNSGSAHSAVDLPDLKVGGRLSLSTSIWFKAAAGTPAGVLFSDNTDAKTIAPSTNDNGLVRPTIYLGTSGKVYGGYWPSQDAFGTPNPIATQASVADGSWHNIVLTGSASTQTMYLDGVVQGSIPGWSTYNMGLIDSPWGYRFSFLGDGYLGLGIGDFYKDQPYQTTTDTASDWEAPFKGSLADFAYYSDRVLTPGEAADVYHAGLSQSTLLTSITRPSGKAYTSIAYNDLSGTVANLTDQNGGTWTLQPPTVTGSSSPFRSAVLGAGPQAYYRLAESAGAANASSQTNFSPGLYRNVTLGSPGPFSDTTAGNFHGVSSVEMPNNSAGKALVNGNGPQSVSMWFNTTHEGVLYSYQLADPSGASVVTNANYVPSMYVGTDGKLYGGYFGLGQIHTANKMSDGKWHLVTLSTSGTSQALYVDGEQVGTSTGTMLSPDGSMVNDYVGVGFIGGSWPDEANVGHTNATPEFFNGTISDVAYFRNELSAQDVGTMFAAGQHSSGLTPVTTVHVTDPAGATLTYTYDTDHGNRPLSTTDGLGKTTSYGYDSGGFDHTVTDPNGNVTTVGHDAAGNPVSSTTCQSQAENKCSTSYQTFQPNTMGTDIAKGAAVTASSSIEQWGWSKTGLTDETPSGYTSASSASANTTQWVQVDLGSTKNIDQVVLLTRTDLPGKGFPSAFKIEVSTNGTTWNLVTQQNNYPAPANITPISFGLTGITGVRYIKLTATTLRTDGGSSYFLQLGELTAVNDGPDPMAGKLLTSRDARSSSATDNTYLTSYNYDAGTGRTTSVVTPVVPGYPSGRTTFIGYADGSITYPAADTPTVPVPAGLPVRTTTAGGAVDTVAYNANGDVASSTDADGLVTSYTYDHLGRALTKKVVSDAYPGGLTTTFTYDKEDRVVQEVAPAVVNRVTGATHQAVTTSHYDPDGDLLDQEVSDQGGGDSSRGQSMTYNAHDQVQTSTDQNGKVTSFTYDAYGNKATQTDPKSNVVTYTYDADGHLLTQELTNFAGNATIPAGRLTEESHSYDPAGRLASVTNAMGDSTLYTYTDNNLPATVTRVDKNGNNPFVEKADGYDGAGNITTETTNNGATVTNVTTDASSRPQTTVVDPTGVNRTTSVTYTGDNNIASTVSSDANGSQTTSATYDPMGRLTSRTVTQPNASHAVAWWPLDATSGTVAADSSGTGDNGFTSATGVTWSSGTAALDGTNGYLRTAGPVLTTTASFTVSVWVNLAATTTSQTVASQTAGAGGGFRLGFDQPTGKWTFTLNNASGGGATTVTGPTATTGAWTHLVAAYDDNTATTQLWVNDAETTGTNTGPVAATGPLAIGATVPATGAPSGQLHGAVDDVQLYQRVLSSADILALYSGGRSAAQLTANQVTMSWTLDKRGLPLTMTDANGNITTSAYDEGGRLAVTSLPAVSVETDDGTGNGNLAPPLQARPVSTSGYDTFGDRTESQDANGHVTVDAYDASGRLLSQTLPTYTPHGSGTALISTSTRTYDDLGNVTQVKDALGNHTDYVYDQLGDVVQTTDPKGNVSTASYDTNGEVLSSTDGTGAVQDATYDHLGRVLTSTVEERNAAGASTALPIALTTNYSYAASTTNPHGAWLAGVTSPGGVTTSTGYDNLGESVSTTDSAGNTTRFTHDFLGRQTATQTPDNRSTTRTYDALGNIVNEKHLDVGGTVLTTSSAVYDPTGRPLSATDADGHTTTFGYTAAGDVAFEVQPTTATTGITTSFGYDATGQQTRFTDGRGNSWTTTYSAWSEPEVKTEPATSLYNTDATRKTFIAYDKDGRQSSQSLPGGVSVSTGYDELSRPTTESGSGADALTAGRTVGYDADGRITSAATAAAGSTSATSESFTYDDRGDLRTATGSAGGSSFDYNHDGQLSDRIDAAGTTSYGYDTSGRLSTVADPATGSTATLSYNTLEQVTGIAYGTGNTRTLGYDNLHRLTSDTLKTSSAVVVASIGYGYDNNGNETSKTTTGFAGATANTYTYDFANRLTSWTHGGTSTAYGYDDSGNRTQVGANVYTYDARDELTSDGVNGVYTYTARGTMSSQGHTTDAYGQAITQDSSAYTYDAMGRLLTDTSGGSTTTLAYSGADNSVASDGGSTYTRDPGGGLVAVKTGGTGVFAYVDAHTDVVGQFTSTGTALSGSTAYDPLGNVLSTASMQGHLGFQSEWTDAANGKVNMMARWYNPATGQFMNKDTASNNPVPDSAAANPFAYGDDDPMLITDPSGHWGFSFSSAWNWTKATAAAVYHYVAPIVAPIVAPFIPLVHAAVNVVKDGWHAVQKTPIYKAVKKTVTAHVKANLKLVQTAWHATTKAASTATSFVKNHAGAIAAFVVSTAVGVGCEAALGALTAGVGAVAGAAICGAVAGAVGGLVTQAFACAQHKAKDACSGSAFLKAGVVGAVTGALGGVGGALGGKLLSAVGGKALKAIGGLFGKGGAEGADSAASGAAEGATDSLVNSTTEDAATSAADDGAGAEASSASRGGDSDATEPTGTESGKSDEAGGGQDQANGKDSGGGCTHSFTGATPVLMADGTTKTIDQVKIGDTVTNSVPGDQTTETHTVSNVIVTTTDHDFVDVTIGPAPSSTDAPSSTTKGPSGLRKTVVVLTAAATLAAGSPSTATLTTTFHHPFYDKTQAAFVEAANLHAGDLLQTPSGTVEVTSIRLYHKTEVTYDLTIDGLHTYYVEAGNTPLLVHNNDFGTRQCDLPRLNRRAKETNEALKNPIAQTNRDTVAMSTENGPDVLASGVRDISPGQREELGLSDVEARLGGQHAEVTAVETANNLGLKPRALSSYPHDICPACRQYLEEEGFSIMDDGKTAVMRTFAEE